MIQALINAAENRRLPDTMVRLGIDSLLQIRRLKGRYGSDSLEDFIRDLKASPIALETKKANHQHYEVPAEFFQLMLGPRLKYSCCNFDSSKTNLEEAEIRSLELVVERSGLVDGMKMLDVGCGWGSLSLYALEKLPNLEVVSVSNSSSQKEFILNRAREIGVEKRLRVETADINNFEPGESFDRVCSIEAFEHMRNYQELLKRISSWLNPEGALFVHIFCHKDKPYLFSEEGAANWMGKHFFSGGMMPSKDLLYSFDEDLQVQRFWKVSGMDYSKTLEAWLERLDSLESEALEALSGSEEPKIALARWRMFLMACSELFNFKGGDEWFVGHYLLKAK